eukprot:XP_001704761.1 Hypothetical protein GL50803_102012 [Giardia lamblia ATCC 50803]
MRAWQTLSLRGDAALFTMSIAPRVISEDALHTVTVNEAFKPASSTDVTAWRVDAVTVAEGSCSSCAIANKVA